MAHAKQSPSSSHTWMVCPASIAMSEGVADAPSKDSAEGSCAHGLAEQCLEEFSDAVDFIGHVRTADGFSFVVDKDMAKHVQTYIDYVRALSAEADLCRIEQKLPISEVTGEAGATGTADAVIVYAFILHIIDLKFGRGVRVSAEENSQLLIYALAAYLQYSAFVDIKEVTIHIVQPRIDNISTYTVSVDELLEFGEKVRRASIAVREAKQNLTNEHFNPGKKQCQFCRAKPNCKPLAEHVAAALTDDAPNLDIEITADRLSRTMDEHQFAKAYAAIPVIKSWIKGIEREAYSKAMNGQQIPGYKLVLTDEGNRRWDESKEMNIEAVLKVHLGEQAYERKIISPTTAEEVLKVIEPSAFRGLQKYIVRNKPFPVLVPESDPRPAFTPGLTDDDFEDLT